MDWVSECMYITVSDCEGISQNEYYELCALLRNGRVNFAYAAVVQQREKVHSGGASRLRQHLRSFGV